MFGAFGNSPMMAQALNAPQQQYMSGYPQGMNPYMPFGQPYGFNMMRPGFGQMPVGSPYSQGQGGQFNSIVPQDPYNRSGGGQNDMSLSDIFGPGGNGLFGWNLGEMQDTYGDGQGMALYLSNVQNWLQNNGGGG
jgi:hypothetical protein